jgi:hypothetical protein
VAFYVKAAQLNDDYQVRVLATAAMLQSKTLAPPEEAMQAWESYKNYAAEAFRKLEEEAPKHFAGAEEMQGALQGLAMFGQMIDVSNQKQITAIGVITDQVKLLHNGWADVATIQHELRGVIEGYAGQHYRLAQILSQQLGPGWKEIVQEHVKAGDLVQFLAEQFHGLADANEDIQNTLLSQRTTLSSILNEILRGGVVQAYQDMIDKAKDLNDWLHKHSDQIEYGLVRGWQAVKDLTQGVLGVIQAIYKIVSVPVSWTITVAGAGATYLASGAGGAGDVTQAFDMGAAAAYGPKPSRVTTPGQTSAALASAGLGQRGAVMISPGGGISGQIGGGKYRNVGGFLVETPESKPPPVRPPDFGAGGGGGGGRDTASQFQSLMDTLEKELARSTKSGTKQIDAWYDEMAHKIEKYAGTSEEAERGITLAKQVRVQKERNLETDYQNWLAKENGDKLKQIDAEEQAATMKYGQREETKRLMTEKRHAEELRRQGELSQTDEKKLKALMAMAPGYAEQHRLALQINEAQYKTASYELERQKATHKITPELYEQRKQLLALERAAANYQEDLRRPQGFGGGARAWAITREQPAQRQAQGIQQFLREFQQLGQRTFANIFKAAISGGSVAAAFKELAANFGDMVIQHLSEGLMNQVMDIFQQIILSSFTSGEGVLAEAGQSIFSFISQGAGELVQAGQSIFEFISSALNALGGILGFLHGGGVIMHGGGAVMAHVGLTAGFGSDERLIRAKVGEGFLSVAAMSRLEAARPGGFGRLLQGEYPPAPHEGRSVQVFQTITIARQNQVEIDRFARRLGQSIQRQQARRVD